MGSPSPNKTDAKLATGQTASTFRTYCTVGVKMLKDIVAVTPLENYQLHLKFEDNKEGVVDLSQIIEFTGIFARLQDLNYFQQVKINQEWGTIYWDNGADLDPDVLYSIITKSLIQNYDNLPRLARR